MGINTLNSTLSDSGLNYLNKLRAFTFKTYTSSNILYLYNIKFNFLNATLQKYLELKLLNFNYNFKLYNTNFFENSSNDFLNVEGMFKTSPKIVSSKLFYSKSDKNILKFFDFYLNKLTYLHCNKSKYSLLLFDYVLFNKKSLNLLF